MKAMSGKDRRKHKRVPLLIPIEIKNPETNEVFSGRVLNISTGGVFIKLFNSFELNQEIEFTIDFDRTKILVEDISLPEDTLRDLGCLSGKKGRVRWIAGGSVGAGLEFDSLNEKESALIKELVEYVDEELPPNWDVL